jgi:lysophospholipase L1-like esterase
MRLQAALVLLLIAGPVHAKARTAPRVAFLGSSATFGVGASNVARRWSTQLARSQGWEELNLGEPGALVSSARRPGAPSALERVSEILTMRADALFFMYGANEIAAQLPVEEFEAEVRVLFRLLWNQHVVVVTPQPTDALRPRRAQYDEVLRRAARDAGFGFVDSAAGFDGSDLAAFSSDGLQLNDAGHARLAQHVLDSLAARPTAAR